MRKRVIWTERLIIGLEQSAKQLKRSGNHQAEGVSLSPHGACVPFANQSIRATCKWCCASNSWPQAPMSIRSRNGRRSTQTGFDCSRHRAKSLCLQPPFLAIGFGNRSRFCFVLALDWEPLFLCGGVFVFSVCCLEKCSASVQTSRDGTGVSNLTNVVGVCSFDSSIGDNVSNDNVDNLDTVLLLSCLQSDVLALRHGDTVHVILTPTAPAGSVAPVKVILRRILHFRQGYALAS